MKCAAIGSGRRCNDFVANSKKSCDSPALFDVGRIEAFASESETSCPGLDPGEQRGSPRQGGYGVCGARRRPERRAPPALIPSAVFFYEDRIPSVLMEDTSPHVYTRRLRRATASSKSSSSSCPTAPRAPTPQDNASRRSLEADRSGAGSAVGSVSSLAWSIRIGARRRWSLRSGHGGRAVPGGCRGWAIERSHVR
jgi:hypothetical protein